MLKHEHLLNHCTDQELVPCIHTATYRILDELRLKVFPYYKDIYNYINCILDTLQPQLKPKSYVFGGKISSFIGTRISWKLLRNLQTLKAKYS
jgi:hypothetical protein